MSADVVVANNVHHGSYQVTWRSVSVTVLPMACIELHVLDSSTFPIFQDLGLPASSFVTFGFGA